jgi:Zn-dependent M32 family carboxypeptidase
MIESAQFFHTARQQNPMLETQISQGNLLPPKTWLNKKNHSVGKQFDGNFFHALF